jgi:pectate lyase
MKKKSRIKFVNFDGYTPVEPPSPPTPIITEPQGWGKVYNNGIGITGGNSGSVHTFNESSVYSGQTGFLAMRKFAVDNPTEQMILTWTGGNVFLPSPPTEFVLSWNGISNKTIQASSGQLVTNGFWQNNDSSNVIVRNWSRQKSYNDAMQCRNSVGMWYDHISIDGEATVPGTEQILDGSLDITVQSDFIYVSNSRLWNCAKTMLIGAADTSITDRGKLRITIQNCHWRNNHIRQPFARFGKIHLLNNLADYSPVFSASATQYRWPRVVEVGFESQIWSLNSYYESHNSFIKDQDSSVGDALISGFLSQGDFYGPGFNSSWTNTIGSLRPENVTFPSNLDPNYTFTVTTPQQAKDYCLQWAGAKYHLKNI